MRPVSSAEAARELRNAGKRESRDEKRSSRDGAKAMRRGGLVSVGRGPVDVAEGTRPGPRRRALTSQCLHAEDVLSWCIWWVYLAVDRCI